MARRPANVTQSEISRAIRAVLDAGLPVIPVRVRPDGEVIVETVEVKNPNADQAEPWDDKKIIFM
ncbi:hypothetical protein [Methylobacterium sp. ap11]|uniref:hypothetical protein n=1 Tax=Methylobacterium sp. ap11 TaxID=1761799 RepID=UPI0011602F39|nr:hypothetical protein [Methylobacterium sp. ap11]